MNGNNEIRNKRIIIILLSIFFVLFVIYTFRDSLMPKNSIKEQNSAINSNPDKVDSFSNYLFSISEPTDDNVITINASIGYRNTAINQIYKMGDDAIYYKITFINYNNPFEAYE